MSVSISIAAGLCIAAPGALAHYPLSVMVFTGNHRQHSVVVMASPEILAAEPTDTSKFLVADHQSNGLVSLAVET